ncbi:helix-turn-helix domain-containing protein [Amycolatopsis sp. NPDC051373]|uniref:MarR family transcriptional regulator n=1 Tax=Amycolatopsis sp. NPDC051373 TaxID=3155801 RepID=UPI0034509CCC
MRVLGTVAARQPVRPNAIAAELGLTASATSRHLAALARAGQIAMEPDPRRLKPVPLRLRRVAGEGRAGVVALLHDLAGLVLDRHVLTAERRA